MVKHVERPEGESLDDLTAEADQLDASTAPPAPPGGEMTVMDPAGPPSNSQLLAGALSAGRDVFCAYTGMQSPKVSLADDQVNALAEAWGRVLDARGIHLIDHLGTYALEFAAVAVTFQIGSAVRAGVIAEISERDAKKRAAAAAENPDDQTAA